MNRLIHRSWGEGFVNILLDLSINISHFFSSTCVCALEERLKGTSRRSKAREGCDLASASSRSHHAAKNYFCFATILYLICS